MHIVFDMDNTLVDEFGRSMRPGMMDLLFQLSRDHQLSVFTTSTKARARKILRDHDLTRLFKHIVCREDYVKKEGASMLKNIGIIKGDVLIDDDPKQIQHVQKLGKRGIRIAAYRHGKVMSKCELKTIAKALKPWWKIWA